jgi:hypothetical protein
VVDPRLARAFVEAVAKFLGRHAAPQVQQGSDRDLHTRAVDTRP